MGKVARGVGEDSSATRHRVPDLHLNPNIARTAPDEHVRVQQPAEVVVVVEEEELRW